MTHAVSSIVPIAHLASYGLAGAFVLALLERLVPVVPSYGLFIFLGSALVGQPLDLVPLILVTTVASTLSAICWYGIGHALGEARTHALVKRYGRYVGLKEAVYLSLAGRYTRNAFIATFMGQTIPVVRCYLSLPAGILALPLATFALAVLIGSSLWVGLFTAMGYGLHVLGWDPLVATLIAVAALITIEGGMAWLLSRRKGAASAETADRSGARPKRFVPMSQNRSIFHGNQGFRSEFHQCLLNRPHDIPATGTTSLSNGRRSLRFAMDILSRSSASSDVANLFVELLGNEGTAVHPYCGPVVHGDRQSFVRDLVDFADFVHLVALLHGQIPGLIDHAASRTVEVSARAWLLQSLEAFAVEREYLGKLCVAVGPLPSTSGHHETSTIIAQQRHAVEMLALSDRRGCALGTAVAMVLEWNAIRSVLDAGALRLGIEPPVCRLPTKAETLKLLDSLPEQERIARAMGFGAGQLLGQHNGMWDLLEARAEVRRSY